MATLEVGPGKAMAMPARGTRRVPQQQLDDFDPPTAADLPTCRLDELPGRAAGVVAIRVLISDAIVMNACSTLVADLAEVCERAATNEDRI